MSQYLLRLLYCAQRFTGPLGECGLLAEGFEDAVVPPADWTVIQTNPDETWTEIEQLTALDNMDDQNFGTDVAIYGDYAVIKGLESGYVFKRQPDGSWE